MQNTDRIVSDLLDSAVEVCADPDVNSHFIDAINWVSIAGNVTRVVIQLKDRKTTAYEAKQMADKLVVTLTRREAPPPEEGYTHKVVNGQSNVIVIDPGHGGKDVGTVGARVDCKKWSTLPCR